MKAFGVSSKVEDTPLGQKIILNIRPRYFAYHPEFEVVDGGYKELDKGVTHINLYSFLEVILIVEVHLNC